MAHLLDAVKWRAMRRPAGRRGWSGGVKFMDACARITLAYVGMAVLHRETCGAWQPVMLNHRGRDHIRARTEIGAPGA